MILTFGKYKGKDLDYVLEKDKQYIDWIKKNNINQEIIDELNKRHNNELSYFKNKIIEHIKNKESNCNF